MRTTEDKILQEILFMRLCKRKNFAIQYINTK